MSDDPPPPKEETFEDDIKIISDRKKINDNPTPHPNSPLSPTSPVSPISQPFSPTISNSLYFSDSDNFYQLPDYFPIETQKNQTT